MMNKRPAFGAIADDLTGGMELAAILVGQGVRCAFVTDVEAARALAHDTDAPEAVVIALKIRIAPPQEAVAAAGAALDALLELGVRQVFYKYCATFDSTDEGNIGPIADMLAERLTADVVLFCPTFPETGCLVFAGHQFRQHTLMSETAKRDDPVTPMRDPNLARVLSRQTLTLVGVLDLATVLDGVEAIGAAVTEAQDAGRRYLIADTIREADLKTIAQAAVDMPLLTGNSSVAAHLPRLWRDLGWIDTSERQAAPPGIAGPAVVLAGSCADQTIAQLSAFEAFGRVRFIDPGQDLNATVSDCLDWVQRQGGAACAIATSADPKSVAELQGRFGVAGASARVDAIFAQLAPALVDHGIRRILVAGGETSGTVVAALGIRRMQIGPYGGPGIARAVSHGEPPLALCLKSGKLGHRDMIWPMLEHMASGEVRS